MTPQQKVDNDAFEKTLERLNAIRVYLGKELEKIEEQYAETDLAHYKYLQKVKRENKP